MFLILVAFVLNLMIFWHMWTRRGLPPGPPGVPIIGYLPWISPTEPYVTLTNLSKRYGSIYGLYLGSVYTVVLSDARMIRQALAKSVFTGRAPLYVTHGIMGGYGLICSEGDLWKNQRKFVSMCLKKFGMIKFGPKRDKMEQWISEGVQEFIQNVNGILSESGDVCFDPHDTLGHCLGNVMNFMVFGKKWNEDDPMWQWLQHLQEEGTKYISVAGPLNFLPFLRFIPKFTKSMHFLLDGKHKTHEIYRKIINEYESSLAESRNKSQPIHTDHVIHAFLEERKALANTSSEQYYCDEQFLHLLADLFGAGLDTTLTTLRWYLLYMACNPAAQQRVYEELRHVVPNKAVPKLEHLLETPYTEASIAETQRIRSVVPVGIPHGSVEETILDGFRIPKGTMLVPLQWAVHMDPDQWDDPEQFNPERFIDDDGKFMKPDAFMPFQTGKRMCVGDELGRMLLFLFGATIVHQFRLSVPDNVVVDLSGECGITLTPKPYRINFSKRH